MSDYLIASRIARAEHEERVRALLREERLLNDIIPEDYEGWMTSSAGKAEGLHVQDLLASVGKRLASLGNKLRNGSDATFDKPVAGQKRRTIAG